jgi:uncharacterized protein YbaR (Trm112 family)
VLPNDLVELLVCPRSKQPLIYFPRGEADRDEADAFLLCPTSRLRYPIQDGVPVMLVDEAIAVTAQTVEALLSRARALGLQATGAGTSQRPDGLGK